MSRFSCECERTVSVLKRLKIPLPSTIGQGRVNGLTMMNVHYTLKLDYEAVMRLFSATNPRKIVLPNLGVDKSICDSNAERIVQREKSIQADCCWDGEFSET